jgi:4-hydroxybenzoate polyprenyltransferase
MFGSSLLFKLVNSGDYRQRVLILSFYWITLNQKRFDAYSLIHTASTTMTHGFSEIQPTTDVQATSTKREARLADYIAITRLDHSAKQIFIVPGIVLAVLLRGVHAQSFALPIVCGFISAICIASANYVINEYLDREFDRHHPTKSNRSAVQRELRGLYVGLLWAGLIVAGISIAFIASKIMCLVALIFGLQGIVYNVQPLRTKDTPFLDVITESVNNPLRLMIGWAMIDPTTLPPSSVLLAYWLGGAFLMAAKRLSEYREIVVSHGREVLIRYRASFAGYTETSLTVSCFLYALLASFFLAVFLIKYRVEYIIMLPLISVLFAHYLAVSMQADSSAQRPEKLYREKGLILLVGLLAILFGFATFVDMPALAGLTEQHFISIQ